jgi:hypothetical protein
MRTDALAPSKTPTQSPKPIELEFLLDPLDWLMSVPLLVQVVERSCIALLPN